MSKATVWSPNGFPPPNCTWYCDGRVFIKPDCWLLKFSKKGNAKDWWDEVKNDGKGQDGHPGDIMVFDKWAGNLCGHVAYVENTIVKGTKWTVTHANFPFQKKASPIQGVPVYQADFQRVAPYKSGPTNYVTLSGGSVRYPLLGFIYKK